MTRRGRTAKRLALALAAAFVLDSGLQAGGPLRLVRPGVPYRWAGDPPTAPLHPDGGALGSLSAEIALSNVREAASAWESIASSSIVLPDRGFATAIVGPEGQGDWALGNVLPFLGSFNGGINPIVFDNEDRDQNDNGDIFDALGLPPGVLGVATPDFARGETIVEGFVLLNGAAVDPADSDGSLFRGVITHELGHFLNFAHSVVNGQAFFFGGESAVQPDGEILPISADDIETMYPFIRARPNGTGRGQSTPSRDEAAIASTLYPAALPASSSLGSIAGTVVDRDGETPVSGVQVIARNWSGDPINDAVSAISGDFGQGADELAGTFTLNALTPGGSYSLEIRPTLGGGFSTPVLRNLLPAPVEYYSGPEGESSVGDDSSAPPFLIPIPEAIPVGQEQAEIILNDFLPPANDSCRSATQISTDDLDFSQRLELRGATLDPNEPSATCAEEEEGGSVWYRLSSSQAADLEVAATGGPDGYAPAVQVFQGSSCQDLQPLANACDDSRPPLISGGQVRFSTQADSLYWIKVVDAVSDFPQRSDSLLNFNLRRETSQPAANDFCDQAQPIDVAQLPFLAQQDATLAGPESGEPLDTCPAGFDPLGYNSVWYRLTNGSGQGRRIQVSLEGFNLSDMRFQVLRGGCPTPEPLFCEPMVPRISGFIESPVSLETSLEVPAGDELLVRVYNQATLSGTTPVPVRLVFDAALPPSNDECSQAVEIDVGDGVFVDGRDTRAASLGPEEPLPNCWIPDRPFASPENLKTAWYVYTNRTARLQELDLSTTASNFGAGMQVYRGQCGSLEALDCRPPLARQNSVDGFSSSLKLFARPGETYFIQVADFQLSPPLRNTQLERVTRGGDLSLRAIGTIKPEIEVSFRDLPDLATVGSPFPFSVAAENLAATPIKGLEIEVSLPVDAIFRSAQVSGGVCQLQPLQATCRVEQADAGTVIVAEFQAASLLSATVLATASARWDGAEPNRSNESMALVETIPPTALPVTLAGSFPSGTPLDDSFVGIAFANLSSLATEVSVQGFDPDGVPSGDTPLRLALGAGAQRAVLSSELGNLSAASALSARGAPSPIRTFLMFGDFQQTGLDGIGRELQAARELYFLEALQSPSRQSRVFLFNPDGRLANVALRAFDAAGSQVAEAGLSLSPGASLNAAFAEVLGAQAASTGGYVRMTSDSPLQGFEVIASSTGVAAAAGQIVRNNLILLAPHVFVDDQGGDTVLRLLNLHAEALQVDAALSSPQAGGFLTASMEIEAGQVLERSIKELFDLGGFASNGAFSASLALTFSDRDSLSPPPFPTGFGVLGSVTLRGGAFETVLPLQSGQDFQALLGPRFVRRTAVLQVAQSSQLNVFTGLSVWNPFTTASQARLEAFDSQGVRTASKAFVLNPGQRAVDLLDGPEWFGPGFDQVGGYLIIEARRTPVLTTALFGRTDLSFLAAIEAQTLPSNDSESPPSSRIGDPAIPSASELHQATDEKGTVLFPTRLPADAKGSRERRDRNEREHR